MVKVTIYTSIAPCSNFRHVRSRMTPITHSKTYDDHDEDGNDTECEAVDNEIHAAAVGEGEYGGIYDGDEDDVISALLALAET